MSKSVVTGSRELIEKLQGLKTKIVKRAIRKGSRTGCKIVQARAKQNVPVITGALRSEIKVRALKRSRRWTGTQVTTRVAGGKVPYGGFVELGTNRMAARHYLKRAAEETKGPAGSAFVEGIRAEIDEAARRQLR